MRLVISKRENFEEILFSVQVNSKMEENYFEKINKKISKKMISFVEKKFL